MDQRALFWWWEGDGRDQGVSYPYLYLEVHPLRWVFSPMTYLSSCREAPRPYMYTVTLNCAALLRYCVFGVGVLAMALEFRGLGCCESTP